MTDLREPLTVTTLRQQIRRGASPALLFRLAGGEVEYRRLDQLYGLAPPIAPPAPLLPRSKAPLPNLDGPPVAKPRGRKPIDDGALRPRQETLLGMLDHMAELGEVFPGALALAEALECSWLVVERDLGLLARRGHIRIQPLDGRFLRRIHILGTGRATAMPRAPDRPSLIRSNAVR